MREQTLRSEEDRGSRLREELLTAREDLSKACLERDMLHSQKMEADNLLSQLESGKFCSLVGRRMKRQKFFSFVSFYRERRCGVGVRTSNARKG